MRRRSVAAVAAAVALAFALALLSRHEAEPGRDYRQAMPSMMSKERNATKSISPSARSPACGPHFRLALPDGNWTTAGKFRRLYFYHVRKAGVSFCARSS